jgi:hypothetical protein
LQELSEVYSIAVDGLRQGFVEFRRNLDARADFVDQEANLVRRKGLATLGNSMAVKANSTAQAGYGLGQPDVPMSDQN